MYCENNLESSFTSLRYSIIIIISVFIIFLMNSSFTVKISSLVPAHSFSISSFSERSQALIVLITNREQFHCLLGQQLSAVGRWRFDANKSRLLARSHGPRVRACTILSSTRASSRAAFERRCSL